MLIVIYTISIFLFSLAYNICFCTEYQAIKDSTILSDAYAVIRFKAEKPKIETLNQWAKKADCHYFMTGSEWSQGKTVAFSENFIRDMELDVSCLKGIKEDADVAIVNEDALNMCHETEDGWYMKLQGETYKVIATYRDFQDDRANETFYYLNQNAKSLQRNNGYDYLLLEPVAGKSLDEITEQFRQVFPEVSVSKWEGTRSGSMDNRPYFILVTTLVAILLCINCIGFSNEWVKAQIQELGIRKLIGATDGQNHCLILKRFMRMILLSFLIGTLMAVCALTAIKYISALGATRSLFGTYFYGKSILLAGVSVGAIGFFMTEYGFFFLKRRNVLRNIRG